jgi:ferredoxin
MERTLRISDSCIGCGQCVKVCIRGHLTIEDGKAAEIDSPYSCFRCGHCEAVCPKDAIALLDSVEEQESCAECPVTPEALADLYRKRRSLRWFDKKCSREELNGLIGSLKYSPTAENSQAVQFAVIDDDFDDFMRLVASILKAHTHEHPRLEQFVDYVDNGMREKNNPFTWEGRQLIIAFSRFPIDSIIAMEQLDLMAYSMGLGGFHSRWILQASENDPERFMSFFPEVKEGLTAYAVFIIGHPRVRFRRTVPRDDREIFWK